jgi:hypothetical protein
MILYYHHNTVSRCDDNLSRYEKPCLHLHCMRFLELTLGVQLQINKRNALVTVASIATMTYVS